MLLVPPLLGLAGFAMAKDNPLILYVSPSGDNTHDGRSDTRAFASIDRAQDEIRKLKSVGALPENGITVEILGGK